MCVEVNKERGLFERGVHKCSPFFFIYVKGGRWGFLSFARLLRTTKLMFVVTSHIMCILHGTIVVRHSAAFVCHFIENSCAYRGGYSTVSYCIETS